jgi:hypothetical protein
MYHDIAFVSTGSLTGPVYVGFLTEPTLCSAYVGSLTGPTLAFCSMADKVWFVSQEPTVHFGSCDSISRLYQVHFSP